MQRSEGESVIWDEPRLADPHRQPDKAQRVRAMFDSIAPSYERVNRVLSAGMDTHWRRRAVKLAEVTTSDRVLDIACGTGDLARAFAAAGPAWVVGADFSEGMLRLAAGTKIHTEITENTGKIEKSGIRSSPSDGGLTAAARHPDANHPTSRDIAWHRADALNLPYADGSFTVVSCAFGVRNFQDLRRGLGEMHRVLCAGGRAVILEFSIPRTPLLGPAYQFYINRILPRAAGWISGDRSGAYRYLPQSVASFFDTDEMLAELRAAGFARTQARRMTFGAVTVYLGWKEPRA